MSSTVVMIRNIIRKDKKYLRIINVFRTHPLYSMSPDTFHLEIETLHKSRTIRTIQISESNFADKVVQACLKDQAVRSRIAEIHADTVRVTHTLTKTIDSFKDYVVIKYSDILKNISTKQERLMVIDTVLSDMYDYISSIDSLSKHCEIILKDIDQAGFAVKHVIAAMQLVSRPEHNI